MQSNQKSLVNPASEILDSFQEHYKNQWHYIDEFGETPTKKNVPDLKDIMYLIAADLIIQKNFGKEIDLLNDVLDIVFTYHFFMTDINQRVRFHPVRKVW